MIGNILYFIDQDGRLFEYSILDNILEIISTKLEGVLNFPCLVSDYNGKNNDKDISLFLINGKGSNKDFYQYSIDKGTYTQLTNTPISPLQPSCIYLDSTENIYLFAGRMTGVYKYSVAPSLSGVEDNEWIKWL